MSASRHSPWQNVTTTCARGGNSLSHSQTHGRACEIQGCALPRLCCTRAWPTFLSVVQSLLSKAPTEAVAAQPSSQTCDVRLLLHWPSAHHQDVRLSIGAQPSPHEGRCQAITSMVLGVSVQQQVPEVVVSKWAAGRDGVPALWILQPLLRGVWELL